MNSQGYASSKYEEEIDSELRSIQERNGFGWSTIRSLGELQVLTRASYIMLIVVPLLAGLWPGVTVVVNRYNDSVQSATQRLEIASDKLDIYVSTNLGATQEGVAIGDIITSLREDIRGIQNSIENVSIESDTMPDVWVWVFLSSLTAILAHTLYQIGAPPIIQQASVREYINSRVDEEIKIRGDTTEMGAVVRAARKEYLYSSRTRQPIAALSMLFYFASLVMIAIVIVDQSRNVLVAAKWICNVE